MLQLRPNSVMSGFVFVAVAWIKHRLSATSGACIYTKILFIPEESRRFTFTHDQTETNCKHVARIWPIGEGGRRFPEAQGNPYPKLKSPQIWSTIFRLGPKFTPPQKK